jgi:NAD(P)-dependent dehydrogenase (short-subunit alcohol dehydrogenase family)
MPSLSGKIALITGASRGIGNAIATRFAAEGAAVVLCASRIGPHDDLPGSLEGAVKSIRAAGGRAASEVCDLSDEMSRSDLVARAAEAFGPLDIIVNNVAAGDMDFPSKITTAQRNRMYDMNVNVPMELAQQALPGMRERKRGWILNIGSNTATQPVVPYPDSDISAHMICAYGATKAAMNRYTQGLAHELANHGIYVNSLAPENIVLTAGADYVREIARRNPKMAEPVEMMAEAALALCTGSHVGCVAYSRQLVHALGLQVRSLDAKKVIGDALMPADLEATA